MGNVQVVQRIHVLTPPHLSVGRATPGYTKHLPDPAFPSRARAWLRALSHRMEFKGDFLSPPVALHLHCSDTVRTEAHLLVALRVRSSWNQWHSHSLWAFLVKTQCQPISDKTFGTALSTDLRVTTSTASSTYSWAFQNNNCNMVTHVHSDR